jgi:hypothetical protein
MMIQLLNKPRRSSVFEGDPWTLVARRVSTLVNSTTVCRQIPAEAGLLIFKDTELWFPDIAAMVKTLSSILPNQRKEIKTIRLRVLHWLEDGDLSLIEHLEGVTRVSVDYPLRPQEDFGCQFLSTTLEKLLGKVELQFV